MIKISRLALAVAIGSTVAVGSVAADDVPSATQVMTDMGLPADAAQRVLAGEFVTADVEAINERDLSIAIAFLVKTSPADLSKQVMEGDFISADSQVKAHGEFKGAGSMSALTPLQITKDSANAFASAQAGSDLNLSKAEIAAFGAVADGDAAAALEKLQEMLLQRYQAYSTKGLAGIAPYARGGGKTSDPAADLKSAANASRGLKKHAPSLQKMMTDYPNSKAPGLQEHFYWFSYDLDGKPTYVLSHVMAAPEGNAAVILQRQYYVSTGYNAEQAVAAFLPVNEGTVVMYTNHTFTDQVAGFGGSMKRSIGRNMMESQLKKLFDKARSLAQ